MTRKRGWRPTASKIAEKQANKPTSRVEIPSDTDKAWLDAFSGRIFFWSFTIGKIKPHYHDTQFRVVTHRHIPVRKLITLVEGAFPDGSKVTPVMGYNFRHTFDVKTTAPMRWDAFIWHITKALEGAL